MEREVTEGGLHRTQIGARLRLKVWSGGHEVSVVQAVNKDGKHSHTQNQDRSSQ